MTEVHEGRSSFLRRMYINTTDPPTMSIDTAKSPTSLSAHQLTGMKSRSLSNSEDTHSVPNDSSVHSYHMWLKEKQIRSEETDRNGSDKITKNGPMKEEEDDDDNSDENFQVDAVLERGPSPPEQENSSSYEWSYEEQFKQLYEIDDDPERKTFLDEYFEYMKTRGTPVSRIPIMAKQILDLFHLYNLVVKHGGLVQVIRNKLWSKITKGLNLPTSITSAAFTLRTQYLKYLYPYECTMHNFSTPKELQAAIDSNRRDRFSTLYHSEPSMTPSRDDRYGGFPLNGCDYPVTQPRHHMPHPALTSSQVEMRYGLKRPGEPLYPPKPYDKYGVDNPKVIVLQDGTPSMTERPMGGKVSPSNYHTRTRSPHSRDSDMRNISDIDASRLRGAPPFSYGKEWDGEARHLMEEESRRRMMDDPRARNGPICKDKNCNGIDCKYARPDFHRHRSHDPMVGMCSCSYCKDYQRSYSPTKRDLPPPSRHHMDGASSSSHTNGNNIRGSNESHTPTSGRSGTYNGSVSSPSPNHHNHQHHYGNNRENISRGNHHATPVETDPQSSKMTTLKMKLPDVSKGGSTIQISLEVGGILYEGVISASQSLPLMTGDSNNKTPTQSSEEQHQLKRESSPVSSRT